jgi:alpha-tubulin suppressor-like RCC1 family protein
MRRDSSGVRSRLAIAAICFTACSSGTGPPDGGHPRQPHPTERLAAGDFFTCALDHTGVAFCWGVGSDGQLGNGLVALSATPVRVSGGPYMAITASGSGVCGLRFDGVAECWGVVQPDFFGNPTRMLQPTPVTSSVSFTHISLGYVSSCGLTDGGAAYCWGVEDAGALADGADSKATLQPVAVAGGHTFSTVSEADRNGCGADTNGAAWCWGPNLYGELGTNDTSTDSIALQPVAVAGGQHYTSVSSGFVYACGVTTSHLVQCWGYNLTGQLGDGTTTNRIAPATVTGSDFVAVFAGATSFGNNDGHTCALDTSGKASCWGYNGYGQLGATSADACTASSLACALTPVAVEGGLLFISLALGKYHTCGMITDGHVYCWGYNVNGELGDGLGPDSQTPVLSGFEP